METEVKKPTVEFDQRKNSLEIRSRTSGSPNVTIYRPERDFFSGKREFKVKPGYINASSFHIKDEQDAVDFKATMANAIRELNDYNSVVPGWVEIQNPWAEVENLMRQVEYLKSERGAAETLARLKKEKAAVKANS